jgi:hypothetical protein
MRSGRIYGLGVGKSFWRRSTRRAGASSAAPAASGPRGLSRLAPRAAEGVRRPGLRGRRHLRLHVGPVRVGGQPRRVRPRRVGRASRVAELGGQCMDRVAVRPLEHRERAGADRGGAPPARGRSNKYDEVWQERMEASGSRRDYARGEQIHELHEWHDGERVLTVLDRTVAGAGRGEPVRRDAPVPGVPPDAAAAPNGRDRRP